MERTNGSLGQNTSQMFGLCTQDRGLCISLWVTASFGARPLIIDERSKQTARSRFPHLEIIKLNNNRKNVKSLD